MKQNAVQNKRYYHGDFRSATIAPEVDTCARNYDLLSNIKHPWLVWLPWGRGRSPWLRVAAAGRGRSPGLRVAVVGEWPIPWGWCGRRGGMASSPKVRVAAVGAWLFPWI